MSCTEIIPVILCGGSGTRLWPLSRESFPKQFLSLNSKNEFSLLQNTINRISDLDNIKSPILVCNEAQRFLVAEQMREIDIKPNSIILEPFGKDTAPAITIAALKSLEQYNNPTLLVLSSDHEIKDKEIFLKVLKSGLKYALKNHIVTFGIMPKSPETGFGYIQAENPFLSENIDGQEIKAFKEKPNLKTAKKYLENNCYLWNSGIFMFKANTIIDEINKFLPELLVHCREALNRSENDLEFQRLNLEAFKKNPKISIDFAIMEKTKKGIVVPLDAGWSDIGSWKTLWENSNKDEEGNFKEGKTLTKNVKNCYMRSENRLVVGLGIKDLIVVDTNDAILISHKSETQRVKEIVQELKNADLPEGRNHKKIYRPWGHYISIVEDEKWQVKLISVKAYEKLSLQMHNFRSEHWVVVSGTAKVEIDGKIDILKENQSIYIPLGSKHRLTNTSTKPLKIIEVQSGSYIGEDDIVRFEDKYGRIK